MLKENLHGASKQKRGLILLGCRVLQKMQTFKNAFENTPKKTRQNIYFTYTFWLVRISLLEHRTRFSKTQLSSAAATCT